MRSSMENGPKRYRPEVLCTLLAVLFVMASQYKAHFPSVLTASQTEDEILMGDLHQLTMRKERDAVPPSRDTLPPKLRVAFAITVTKDGPYADGAAVLAESIRNSCGGAQFQAFAYDLVAITHDNVTSVTVSQLEHFGWHVWRRPLPVRHEEMEQKYREIVDAAGCCGALEFLKLYAYVMRAYHRVMLLDMDTLVTGCLDPIFTYDAELLFTPDNSMCKPCVVGSETRPPPAQGGFLVVRPNNNTFIGLNDLVRGGMWFDGNDKRGNGWNHTGIGWYWGGRTIQGILPFYYTKIARGQAKVLDHCIYNNMVADGSKCDNTTIDQVQSAHFTTCQKPWRCMGKFSGERRLCDDFHERWFEARELLEDRMGIARGVRNSTKTRRGYCENRKYDPIPWKLGKPVTKSYFGGMDPWPEHGFGIG